LDCPESPVTLPKLTRTFPELVPSIAAKAVLNPTVLKAGGADAVGEGTTEKETSNGGLTPASGLVEMVPLAPVDGPSGLVTTVGELWDGLLPPEAGVGMMRRVEPVIIPATEQDTVVFPVTGADP
jgi:hypothetical protein